MVKASAGKVEALVVEKWAGAAKLCVAAEQWAGKAGDLKDAECPGAKTLISSTVTRRMKITTAQEWADSAAVISNTVIKTFSSAGPP